LGVTSTASIREISDSSSQPAVRGFLHVPDPANGDGLVLTHSAGANCQSKLLTSLASAFAETGFTVLRCDLPFRQQRPHGPPSPGSAATDRDGLRRAIAVLRPLVAGRVYVGGHSYGGRQATMLLADNEGLAAGLLLLSYPLHPPRKPAELRVKHFPQLSTPALFVHGSRDPFGSIAELGSALKLIPARTELMEVPAAGHDLASSKAAGLPAEIVQTFQAFFT
jgi:predicted alpha/beta-hydrolase family hydrolase